MVSTWCTDQYNGTDATESICLYTTWLELPPCILFLLLGAPKLWHLYRQPKVSAAPSRTFRLKIVLSLIAEACCLVLLSISVLEPVLFQVTMLLASFGWAFSITVLIVGNRRAQPQEWVLRAWWVISVCTGGVLFYFHRQLHVPGIAHHVRAVYLLAVAGLAVLSAFPQDQPQYEAIDIDDQSILNSPSLAYGAEDDTQGGLSQSAAAADPLLERRLSEEVMYGATHSQYKQAFLEWQKALHARNQGVHDDDVNVDGQVGGEPTVVRGGVAQQHVKRSIREPTNSGAQRQPTNNGDQRQPTNNGDQRQPTNNGDQS